MLRSALRLHSFRGFVSPSISSLSRGFATAEDPYKKAVEFGAYHQSPGVTRLITDAPLSHGKGIRLCLLMSAVGISLDRSLSIN